MNPGNAALRRSSATLLLVLDLCLAGCAGGPVQPPDHPSRLGHLLAADAYEPLLAESAEVLGNERLQIDYRADGHLRSVTAPLPSNACADPAGALWLPPALDDAPPPPLSDVPPMDAADWERTLDELAPGSASHGSIDYMVDGEEFFPALVHAIGQARESIRMRLYIFDNDDYAMKIADLLKARSREIDTWPVPATTTC